MSSSAAVAVEQKNSRSVFGAWLPVLLWLVVIVIESTDLLSSGNTGSVLYRIVNFLFGHVNYARFEVFHAVLRKCGHFVGYAVLSILFFRALTRSIPNAVFATICRFAALSVGFTFLVASVDEWHQSFLSSRTGTVTDVLLDSFAAITVQLIVVILVLRRRRAFRRA